MIRRDPFKSFSIFDGDPHITRIIFDTIEDYCRREGFPLHVFTNMYNLPYSRHRQGKGREDFKYPPHIKFVNLTNHLGVDNDESTTTYKFAVGMRRIHGHDPLSGGVEMDWDFNIGLNNGAHEYDVTSWAAFEYADKSLTVTEVHAPAICERHLDHVKAELQREGWDRPRIFRDEREVLAPWDFRDRHYLWAPVALKFAQDLDAKELRFDTSPPDEGLITRVHDFTLRYANPVTPIRDCKDRYEVRERKRKYMLELTRAILSRAPKE